MASPYKDPDIFGDAPAVGKDAEIFGDAPAVNIEPPAPPVVEESPVPKWGQENPNAYAATMTALDMVPALASIAGKAKVGVPISAALSAGAGGIKRAIEGKPQTLADFATDAARGAGIEGAGRGVGKIVQFALNAPGIKQGLSKIGEKLYASAMKFSTSPKVLTPVERKAIIQTGLRGGYMPDEASYLRLQNNVNANTKAVNEIIDQGTQAGDTIPAEVVIEKGGLSDLLTRGEQVRGVAPGYGGAVNKTVNTFKRGERVQMPEQINPDPIDAGIMNRKPQMKPAEPKVTTPYTPNDINAAKRQVYQELEDAYRKGTLSNASVQSKKQLAHGMKTVLEDMYPEIGSLNANSKDLLDLSDHLARSIGRVGNRDIVGLGDKIVMDTIAAIPKDGGAVPKTLYGAVMAAIDRPIVKAKLARVLYKANTGQELPLSQWQKGAQYLGKAVNSAPGRAAMEGYMLSDPLGIR